jgi:cell division control protein 45
MILTDAQQWVDLYEGIKEETRRSAERHVHIYVSAADADSVAALRILESLLRNDLVPYGWTAVSRYQEVIDDFAATYEEGDDVTRFVILINCGASEDVAALLGLGARPHVCVVVVDAHRPIMHLANEAATAGSQLYVLLDEGEGTARADVPPAETDDDEEDDEEEGASGDEGERGENADGNAARQRRRLEGADGAPADDSPRARRNARRAARDAREAARQKYYGAGASHGKPSACVLFDLAFHLRQDSAQLLWLALVGLTDHLVHGRAPAAKYEEWALAYESHAAAGGHLDAPRGYEAPDGEGGAGGAATPACRIAPTQDFRFGLLREWTLWDAMEHSPYVAARLQTYTEKGRQRLEFLLAKLGIPLREARAPFQTDMRPRYRARLAEQLAAHGAAYSLGDALFRSFQLQDGYARCVMAVDAVLAATALLEAGGARRAAGDPAPPPDAPPAGDHRDRFWRAWAALSWRDDGGELRRGLELAKKVQRALVADGGAAVTQRLFHNFRAFRVFDLSEHKLGSRGLLAAPLALQRLAAFFQEQHLHASHANRRKPVVLVGPKDPASGRCLVVGYQVAAPGRGNRLGLAFVQAAEEVGAHAWLDLFDTSVVEVAGADVERFKAELLRVATELL